VLGKSSAFEYRADNSLAQALMRMFLARLVWEFDISLVDPSEELNYRWGLLQVAPAMYVRISDRLASQGKIDVK
jgi:hypothetical protein